MQEFPAFKSTINAKNEELANKLVTSYHVLFQKLENISKITEKKNFILSEKTLILQKIKEAEENLKKVYLAYSIEKEFVSDDEVFQKEYQLLLAEKELMQQHHSVCSETANFLLKLNKKLVKSQVDCLSNEKAANQLEKTKRKIKILKRKIKSCLSSEIEKKNQVEIKEYNRIIAKRSQTVENLKKELQRINKDNENLQSFCFEHYNNQEQLWNLNKITSTCSDELQSTNTENLTKLISKRIFFENIELFLSKAKQISDKIED